MRIIGVIPARMGSSRFPGKPLAEIHGMPMIGHCYYRSKMASILDEVYIATCDEEIFDYMESIGAKSIMTSETHQRASERTAEALTKIEEQTGEKVDIVVLIQGDEPMVIPDMIEKSVKPLLDDQDILVANLMSVIENETDHSDTNQVKVVTDLHSNALYFSREPIPAAHSGQDSKAKAYKQVCIIPFQRDFLLRYIDLNPTPLEIAESIDMNRVLEHGYDVHMVEIGEKTFPVDTPEDLKKVESLMDGDFYTSKYLNK